MDNEPSARGYKRHDTTSFDHVPSEPFSPFTVPVELTQCVKPVCETLPRGTHPDATPKTHSFVLLELLAHHLYEWTMA